MNPQALVALALPALSGTFAGNLIAGAIGLAINFGIAALLQKEPPKPKAQKGVIKQDTPVRTKFYGRGRVGAKLLFMETIKGDLYQVFYFGQGPIDGVEEYYVDDRFVELNPDGTAAGGGINNPYVDLDGDNHLTILVKLGTEDQTAFSELVALAPTIWTEDHRGRCQVMAFVRQGMTSDKSFGKIWPNRYAQVNLVVRGCPVFDPRVGERRWFDPENPAKNPGRNLPLMLREYLTDPDGAQIDASYIEDDPNEYGNFCYAADRADDLLPTKGGGTVHRYYGQFGYDFDSEPGDNVKRLLQAFAGRLFLKPNGKIGVYPGEWIEPTIHITEEHLTFYELRDRSGPLRDANEVIVRYTKPASRYGEGVSDPWRDEDDITAVGHIKTATVEAYEIQNHNHARRIAKLTAARGNPRWQGTIRTTLFGMNCWDQWTVILTVEDLDIVAETFEIQTISYDDDRMEVTMEIASLSADAIAFDPETEEGTEPADPADLEPENTPEPIDLEAHCEQRDVSGVGSIAVLVATWGLDANYEGKKRRLVPEAQYSIADADVWLPMAVAESNDLAESGPVQDGVLYDVRVRWLLPSGTPGNWGIVENILAVADDVPPAAPDIFVTVSTQVTFTVTASDSENVRSARVRRGTTSQSFADATLIRTLNISPNQTIPGTDSPGPGTWRYWAENYNGSGVGSGAPVFMDVTVV